MSMNLYIKFDGVKQALYQTPTYITNMCLMTAEGINYGGFRGKKAKCAVLAYLEYCRGMMDGVYNSQEEYERYTARSKIT